MNKLNFLLFVFIIDNVCVVTSSLQQTDVRREFRIDYANDQFLRDGQPFRYVSGSLHYFRLPSIYWRDRLTKFRLAGLNAVSTYVEWRLHEKTPGAFDFSGELNLMKFIQIAAEEGLLVLLRPGPYICAEREMGGLPYWLLRTNPNMQLRTKDPTYMSYVQRWLTVLMTRVTPLLYGNGGPIILVQVENEYGSYFACDIEYLALLRDIMHAHVGNAAVLYSTDGNGVGYLKCGKIDGVYATVDFGTSENVSSSFAAMRKYEPHGPLVNSEFYTGWLDHWGEEHNRVSTNSVVNALEQLFAVNASFNFYLFFGGTNFGFTAATTTIYQNLRNAEYLTNAIPKDALLIILAFLAPANKGADILDSMMQNGANLDLSSGYQPQPTSYDYDAPLTEAGDPTDKYFALRNTVLKYMPTPPGNLPRPAPKGDYGSVSMRHLGSFLNLIRRKEPIKSRYPLTFEALDQFSGFVAYQTRIIKCFPDPANLSVPNVRDRAQVFVNGILVGTLSRMEQMYSMPIQVVPGDDILLLIENQGRVNYGSGLNDFKGLVKNVTINGRVLEYWSMYKLPFEDHGDELSLISEMIEQLPNEMLETRISAVPSFYFGDFVLPSNITVFPPPDTFLDLAGWFKGVAFVNGINIGRYWSVAGPQRTLYLPGSFLKLAPNINHLLLFELERAPVHCTLANPQCEVRMRTEPILNTRCATGRTAP